MCYNKHTNWLYITLVFTISLFITKIDSTLWINVFEVILSVYFTLIYEEMKCMRKNSHGVGSCKCVETSVMKDMKILKLNID